MERRKTSLSSLSSSSAASDSLSPEINNRQNDDDDDLFQRHLTCQKQTFIYYLCLYVCLYRSLSLSTGLCIRPCRFLSLCSSLPLFLSTTLLFVCPSLCFCVCFSLYISLSSQHYIRLKGKHLRRHLALWITGNDLRFTEKHRTKPTTKSACVANDRSTDRFGLCLSISVCLSLMYSIWHTQLCFVI